MAASRAATRSRLRSTLTELAPAFQRINSQKIVLSQRYGAMPLLVHNRRGHDAAEIDNESRKGVMKYSYNCQEGAHESARDPGNFYRSAQDA